MHSDIDRRIYLLPVMFIVYMSATAAFYGGSVASSYMVGAIPMSRGTLGLGFTLFGLLQGVPAAIFAMVINRRGVRFAIVLGCTLMAAGATLMAFVVENGWQYIVAYGVVMGLGFGFAGTLAVQTWVTQGFRKHRTLAMSLMLTAGGISGLVVAPTMNRLVAGAGGDWRASWTVVIGLTVLAAILTFCFVKSSPSGASEVTGDRDPTPPAKISSRRAGSSATVYRTAASYSAAQARRTPALWLTTAAAVGFNMVYNLCVAQAVVHLSGLGLSRADAALSVAILGGTSIAGRLAAGALGDRVEPRLLWAAALGLCLAGSLVIVRATTIPMMALYAVLVGLGVGASMVCYPTVLGNYFGPRHFASINAMTRPILTLLGTLPALLGGVAYDLWGSYTVAFVGAAALAGLGAVAALVARPPRPPAVAPSLTGASIEEV